MKNIIFIAALLKLSKSQDIAPLVDTKTLSELPLDKLLKVKNTFEIDCENDDEYHEEIDAESRSDETLPEALPLQGKQHVNRGSYGVGGHHGHYEEQHSKKGGKKSLQSIFQISVTTLAFLAFGGYLLCLIVQAIKGKDMNMNMEMMNMNGGEMMAAFIRRPQNRPVAVRRPTRRKPTRNRRPNRRPNIRHKREVWPNADPEKMYDALIMLSEAYTNYHTVDYRSFNRSRSYF